MILKIVLFYGYWLTAARMDWKTYYLPPWFLLLSAFFLFLPVSFHPLSFLYAIAAFLLLMSGRNSIGYADVIYLFEMAFLFDVYAMNRIILLSVLCGFFVLLVMKKEPVPFVTCLSAGIVVSGVLEWISHGIMMP